MKVFCAWCYPNGTNSPIYERAAQTAAPAGGSAIGSAIGSALGGMIGPMPISAQASNFAQEHIGESTTPGSGLWCGYGDVQPDTYWLHHSIPL